METGVEAERKRYREFKLDFVAVEAVDGAGVEGPDHRRGARLQKSTAAILVVT